MLKRNICHYSKLLKIEIIIANSYHISKFLYLFRIDFFTFEKNKILQNLLLMKLIIRPFLLFVSVLLFGWLLMSNITLINVAATLNEAEISSEVTRVNSFSNLDQLKKFTIEKISYMEVIRKRFSDNAMIRIAVLSVLALIQIILYTLKGNEFKSKSLDF